MSHTMTAVRFHEYGGAEKLATETIERPQPKANEVLVKVHYAGVNPADWKIRAGYLKDFMPLSFPSIAGADFSGTVEEIGAEVKNLEKGQAVFGVAGGSYAEYAVALGANVCPKPDEIGFAEAATVPIAALTAWKNVEDAGVRADQTVVVQGAAGGVGLFAVQFARLRSAKVIGTASTANLSFVEQLGAEPVDYTKGPIEGRIKDVDVVIDTVGGEVLERSYALLRKGGVLVTIAGQASEEKARKLGVRAFRSGRGGAELLGEIALLLATHTVVAEVGTVFPLVEARAAQELCQTGHGRGRILLEVAR